MADTYPPLRLRAADLDRARALFERVGFRLDAIMPADDPRRLEMSAGEQRVILVRDEDQVEVTPFDDGPLDIPALQPEWLVTRAGGQWTKGRAGMLYRDLVPSRLGGHVIASHIRIPDGGPVPDQVHHHRVRFQIIFCRRGWVRVLYEGQGGALTMRAGDCVVQPPHIRHRVLEASAGLEVVELGTPAEHTTRIDHAMALPGDRAAAATARIWDGQRFVHFIAAEETEASWESCGNGWERRRTGIEAATEGVGVVHILRPEDDAPTADGRFESDPRDGVRFGYVLEGSLRLRGDGRDEALRADDAWVVPPGARYGIEALDAGTRVLDVRVRRV